MKMSRTSALLFLATCVSSAEASGNDPTYCYVLDVFLLLYSIIFTALYFRLKFTKEGPVPSESETPARNPNEPVYTDLDLPQVNSDYQQLDRPIRRREPETHYQELRAHTSDEYQQIGTKGNKEPRANTNDEYQQIAPKGTKPRKAKSKSNEGRQRKREAAEVVEMETFPL